MEKKVSYLRDECKKKLPFGNDVPKFRDGILRFRDPENGLWRRYEDFCMRMTKDGLKAVNGFGLNGNIIGEGRDAHMVATNGTRVFLFN